MGAASAEPNSYVCRTLFQAQIIRASHEELTEDQFQKTLGEIKRSLLYFNEEMNVSDIFDAMLKEKSQIGVVIDEYGCLQGIITFEDVIETIFGLEIIDEMDVVTDMQQYARERWQLRQKRFKPVVMRSTPEGESEETNPQL